MEMEKEKAAASSSEAAELPKAIVRRIVKDKLSRCSEEDMNIHKDALTAFSESARIFIHYLSATANDLCRESKRQTISSDDVFKALEEIEFHDFIDPLRASLDEFRKKNAGKKKTVDENKKRKLEEEASAEKTKSNHKDKSPEEEIVADND